MISITELQSDVKECNKCYLRGGCNQVVAGIGPPSSLLIIGEAPGSDEDIMGEPFVGQCGQLLNKLMKSAGLDRNNIYITNTVKCRPKGNATPDELAINTCKSWLWKELQINDPKIIVTLGKVSTGLLLKLKPSFKMKEVIDKVHDVAYIKSKIMPWYHPSYLLRQGSSLDKRTIEFFMKVKEKSNEY